MYDSWLGVPGPADAMRRVLDALDAGRSVILGVPTTAMGGWGRRLRRAGGERADWIEVPLDVLGGAPERVVRQLAGYQPTAPISLRDIVAAGSLRGRRIVVELPSELPCGAAGGWIGLVTKWAQFSHAKSLADRACFALVAGGRHGNVALQADEALAVRQWRGVGEAADMQLYASIVFRGRFQSTILRSVAGGIAASLAAWDPVLAEELADVPLRDLCAPGNALVKLASDRGWTIQNTGEHVEWWRGMVDEVGGVPIVHSCVLALRGESVRLRRRVWSGQVGILFPFVEERRQELVDWLGKSLHVPHKTKFGTIMDRRDLEISHIRWQVQQRRVLLPKGWGEALDMLVGMRHALSHLDVISEDVLTSSSLASIGQGFREV